MSRFDQTARKLAAKKGKQLAKLYLRHGNYKAVAEEMGLPKTIVLKALHLLQIKVRKPGHPRQAPLNETFFDKINSEDSAYCLGFLAADGCVTGWYIKLRLAAKDKSHLEKIRDAICPGRNLYERKCKSFGGVRKFYDMDLYSPYMVESLGHLGIGPRKTTSLRPCTQIPERYKQAYWRGFFDGDGSICKHETPTGTQWRLSVSGTYAMMLGFWNWAKQFVPKLKKPIKTQILADGTGFWRVSCGGTAKPKLLARALYLGAGIALERKQYMAEELMQFEVKRKTKAYMGS